ncbi:hypothetical protein [Pontibacter cellulosilyticus]|uniref:GLPGLI family protein n=1 Tax=Pontibacter cellulosilyticus TaxID=1720253 RepID=A0A923SJH7_9BACT|nr:hypothetical protein [Pontibacter cellulosilyticus]MBC5993833.1 hypothetical protein [Pontibacter cellulosilyticus]
MKKLLTATLTLVVILVISAQASAQVATFNSLSLHFSNTILTTAQYQQVLEGTKPNKQIVEDTPGKQALVALPATGYAFGDNTLSEPAEILATPVSEAEPMAIALDNWINKELALQQPKRRGKN